MPINVTIWQRDPDDWDFDYVDAEIWENPGTSIVITDMNEEATEAVESEYDVETGQLLVKLVIATELLEQMLVSGEEYIEVYVKGLLLDGQTRFAGSDIIKAGYRNAKKGYGKTTHENKGHGKGGKKG